MAGGMRVDSAGDGAAGANTAGVAMLEGGATGPGGAHAVNSPSVASAARRPKHPLVMARTRSVAWRLPLQQTSKDTATCITF